MSKPKKSAKKSVSILKCTINSREFYAEGTQEEVMKKFDEFLAEAFAPIKQAMKAIRGE